MAKQLSDKKKQTMKKKWFPIVTPKMFNETVIGESFLYEPSEAVGRTTTANLMQLTGDVKNQNVTIKFMIVDTKDNKLLTYPKEYQIGSTSIRRLIRRRQNKIDDSISVSTSDGKRIRIKPLALTRNRAKGSVKGLIRKTIRQEIINFVKKNNFETVFSTIIAYRLQREIREKLAKIYPIKTFEIRVLTEEKRTLKKETEIVMPQKTTKKKEKARSKQGDEEAMPEEEAEAETPEEAPEVKEEPVEEKSE